MQPDTIRLRELTLRYDVKRDLDGREIHIGPRLRTPHDSAELLMAVLQNQPSEVFAIVCLSTRHNVIAYHEVARGTLGSVIVEPREVFNSIFSPMSRCSIFSMLATTSSRSSTLA